MSAACLHCQQPVLEAGDAFCCTGCARAYALIQELKLGNYYLQRTLDPAASLRPDAVVEEEDLTPFVQVLKEGEYTLHLLVEKLHCASCVWLIEQVLMRQAGVTHARINMSTRRLVLSWCGAKADGNRMVALIHSMGYRLKPFSVEAVLSQDKKDEAFLLRCLAVAGFSAGNIMLLSISLWSSDSETMGVATRTLFHWVSALIALPTVVYSGQPFFRSAWGALKNRRTNIDVPISLALVLAPSVSLYETISRREHAYFDSAVMLLFFLLIGRYFERRARARARQAAQNLLLMMSSSARIRENGRLRIVRGCDIAAGMVLEVAAGERIAADGVVKSGVSELDTSLITGESLPQAVAAGQSVFAGTLNINAPLQIEVTKGQGQSLLADIIRMMEQAEQKQSAYVRLADRVTRYYTPVVHVLALSSFAGWLVAGAHWTQALMVATTVLIITCPCALALAVPVVQVTASGRLFRQGIFTRSADALERLAAVDTVVFDKTGTLTLGQPELKTPGALGAQQYQLAASMAQYSRHPLAKAILRRYQGPLLELAVREHSGAGLEAVVQGETVRLGNRGFCGVEAQQGQSSPLPETWFRQGQGKPVQLLFEDAIRRDAGDVVAAFRQKGFKLLLLSGDKAETVEAVARQVGIADFFSHQTPAEKMAVLRYLKERGRKVMMVGDGLNDAPALVEADVSMSPSSAMDITQNAADVVFQGERLAPTLEALDTALLAHKLARQNIAFSIGYNVFAVPLAIMGMVTPLVAALAMSSSSIIVVANALRVRR